MGNNQSLEERLQRQQQECESLRETLQEQRLQVEGLQAEGTREQGEQGLQALIFISEQQQQLNQKIEELELQHIMDMERQSQELEKQHKTDMERLSQNQSDRFNRIQRTLHAALERELNAKIDDLKREHDQKIDQLLKQQEEKIEEKIEETKKIIYEEIRQQQLKEAEERRKFKEEYPIPKFLNPDVINVAITGPSGAGKSTLVNLLRGIKHGEVGEAKTGVNECTKEPHSYTFAKTHPLHKLVYLWDLPGAGTDAFPQKTYIQNMGIRWFDAVMVVGDTRVRDVDVSLMKELKRTLVRFVYVRTKIDHQVEDNQLKNIDPKQTFKEVRENLQTKNNIQRPYLIGQKYVLLKGFEEWENADFVELKKELEIMCVESVEENQKEELSESVKNSYLKFDILMN